MTQLQQFLFELSFGQTRRMTCPQGELLTDKELERMKLHNPRRDWPKTAKAKVY